MSEPVFLRHSRGLTVAEIATITGAATPVIDGDSRRLSGIATLDRASPTDLVFLDSRFYAAAALTSRAGACLTTQALAVNLPVETVPLIVKAPYRAFITAAREMYPHALRPSSLAVAGSVAGAHVDKSARLEPDVTIEPGAVIGPHAEIGSGTLIGANAVVGAEVRIGRDCAIGSGATVTNALIGNRVVIHSGCKIGQDGFGYVMSGTGHMKVPQIGRVIIQDEVEIGAGTTVDRGALRDTVIGEGSKIDNLVQIGHNVTIGRHCIIIAQTGISGSATLEDFVVLGARVGLNNQVTIGEGAQIAAVSVVHSDVPPGARWGGTPAKPVKLWFREIKLLEQMARRIGNAKSGQDEQDEA
jgi:UDP-3-O-[3-hydroxymyristoyl] glucosamine N-acyltransferase